VAAVSNFSTRIRSGSGLGGVRGHFTKRIYIDVRFLNWSSVFGISSRAGACFFARAFNACHDSTTACGLGASPPPMERWRCNGLCGGISGIPPATDRRRCAASARGVCCEPWGPEVHCSLWTKFCGSGSLTWTNAELC